MKTKQKRDRRIRLLRKNGPCCYWCHEIFPPYQLTLDHLKPRSRGGSNKLENLRLACFPCNNRRSDSLERSGRLISDANLTDEAIPDLHQCPAPVTWQTIIQHIDRSH